MTLTQPLLDLLNADATLIGLAPAGAWLSVAPSLQEAAAGPCIVVRLLSAPLADETMCGSDGRTFRYQVYAEAMQTEIDTVRAIVARLFALLHRQPWSAGASWQVVRSRCADLIEESLSDGQYRMHRLGVVLEVEADQQ